jgi:hypothetical protein
VARVEKMATKKDAAMTVPNEGPVARAGGCNKMKSAKGFCRKEKRKATRVVSYRSKPS